MIWPRIGHDQALPVHRDRHLLGRLTIHHAIARTLVRARTLGPAGGLLTLKQLDRLHRKYAPGQEPAAWLRYILGGTAPRLVSLRRGAAQVSELLVSKYH